MKPIFQWLLLAGAVFQFGAIALPPWNADLISIQSLALDLSRDKKDLLYPGKGFARNDEWVAHHEANLKELGDRGEPNWCFYPPLVPYFLSPFAVVKAETWRVVWGILQYALILIYALLIERLLRVSDGTNRLPRVLIFALVIGCYPVARAVELGQTSILIALLLWTSVYIGFKGRSWLRAVMFGIAIFVKPFLGVVELPNLIRKRFKLILPVGIVFAGLMALSLALVGLSANREYWNLLTTLSSSQTAFFGNQSLFAGLLRLFSDLPVYSYGFAQNIDQASIGKLLWITILLIALWAQMRARVVNAILSTGLWLCAVSLALPISWDHHMIFLLPVIAYLWSLSSRRSEYVVLGVVTALICVSLRPVYAETYAGRLWACLPLLGNLILFVQLIVIHVGKNSLLFSKANNPPLSPH